MVSCSDLSIREISGGTVYLQGTITGLSNHKEYCLKYYDGDGNWRNVLTRNLTYTYTRNVTSLNTGSVDCWIPESARSSAGKYYVAMYEVVSRCENVVGQVCDKYVELEEKPSVFVAFRVSDQDGASVVGAKVNVRTALGSTTLYTDSTGYTSDFEVESGKSHTASITFLPEGYAGTSDSNITFTPYGHTSYNLFCRRRPETCIDGAERSPIICDDDSTIHEEICRGGEWVASGEKCPEAPVPGVLVISPPASATEGKPFNVPVTFDPNKRIEIKRRKVGLELLDPVIGSGTTNSSGKTTISCTTTVVPSVQIYGCYDFTLIGGCKAISTRYNIQINRPAELGTITKVTAPTTPKGPGDKLAISCVVKNTGEQQIECRCKLIDVASGEVIDEEPDYAISGYKRIGIRSSATFIFHEMFGTGKPVMPDHEWHLKIEAWDIDGDTGKYDNLLDTSDTFIIPAETEECTLVTFSPTTTAREKEDVGVDVVVKNTGNSPCELVWTLLEGETVLDENPDRLVFSLGAGKTMTHNVSTDSHLMTSMPDHDWKLRFKLDEYGDTIGNLRGAHQKTHIDKEFTVEIDKTYAEGGEFVGDLTYPEKAHEGDEIDVGFKVKNTGDKRSELYVKLSETRSGYVINTEPDIIKKIVDPGDTWEGSITTNWHLGAMPDEDWDLTLTLWEYDPGPEWLNPDDKLDEKRFTITFVEDEEFIAGDLTLEIPGFSMAGDIDVTGEGPPGWKVDFMVQQSFFGFDILAKDTELGSVMIGADGKYASTITLNELGQATVYAVIRKGSAWMEYLLPNDVKSKTHTIFIMPWMIVIALVVAIGLILEKKYGKLGLFGGKK